MNVTLKFKGSEEWRQIPDVAMVKRGETCQCPREKAETIVTQDPDGWEIIDG
jgi:hypothetical protein